MVDIDTLRVGDVVIGPNGRATVEKILGNGESSSICVLYDGFPAVLWGDPEQYTLEPKKMKKGERLAAAIRKLIREAAGTHDGISSFDLDCILTEAGY